MKKLITVLTAVILAASVFAQAPQKMSYQAVIRNSSSMLITSTAVGMRISILQGSSTGTPVYVETQTPTSNTNGLVSLEIGAGTIVTGTFATINWASGPYFIKTETAPLGGAAYSISGTSELLSVPYALHSKTAESITGGITETDPVFIASPANGITSTNITNWNNKLDTEVDGSVTNEIQALSISNDTVYLTNGGFVKLPAGFDGNYNSLTNMPSNVSTFTNDAGYLTSFTEIDGSVTNEIQALSISNDTIYLSNGGFVKLPAGFDGNYNSLTNKPTNISAFTNDAGYLTTEADSSVTNEIQTISRIGSLVTLSNGGGSYIDSVNVYSAGIGINITNNIISTTTHYIGESYGGGIVFYVYDNGQHGLIAAITDQSGWIDWHAGTMTNTMARADGIGAGKANTAIIIANQGYGDGATYPARACNEYSVTVAGVTYGDWYLPSKFELNLLYLQKTVVGGVAPLLYWSSTESQINGAWSQYFDSGGVVLNGSKNNGVSTRAIRSF